MDQTKIFAPFVGVLLLTLVVWLYEATRTSRPTSDLRNEVEQERQ